MLIRILLLSFAVLLAMSCTQRQGQKKEEPQQDSTSTPKLQPSKEQELVSGTDPFIKYYEGRIGENYPIAMTLLSWGDGTIDGKYMYQKVGEPIDLIGELQLDESFVLREYTDYDATGKFKGSFSDPTHLEGTWQNADSSKVLQYEVLEKSNSRPDKVGWRGTWDMNGEYEGGKLIIGHVTDSTFHFGISVVRGGHVGVILNEATYEGNSGVFNKVIDGPGDPCILYFSHKGDRISITQDSGPFECGFGARAHAEGTFIKR